MNSETATKPIHIGRNIEKIRKLRGLTQDTVGKELNITKQAVSLLEQSEKIEESKLQRIADALGVTLEGLKGFKEEGVFNYTNIFYESTTFNNSVANAHNFTVENPLEKIIELYESLLKSEREKIQILQNRKS